MAAVDKIGTSWRTRHLPFKGSSSTALRVRARRTPSACGTVFYRELAGREPENSGEHVALAVNTTTAGRPLVIEVKSATLDLRAAVGGGVDVVALQRDLLEGERGGRSRGAG